MVPVLRQLSITLGLCLSLLSTVSAQESLQGKGFIGLGIELYNPECGFICSYGISPILNCTEADMPPADGAPAPALASGPGWQVTASPSLACKVHSTEYLQTLAHCLKTRCSDQSLGTVVEFWQSVFEDDAPEGSPMPPSYAIVVENMTAPTIPFNATGLLNYTALFTDDLYLPMYNSVVSYAQSEYISGMYSLIIFFTGALLPVGLSLLRLLPWPQSTVTKFNAYFIDAPIIDPKRVVLLSKLFVMPTRGQAIFIAYLFIINIVLTAAGYSVLLPNQWYPTSKTQILRVLANRTGILAMSNFPLVILYAGRNSILLWVTNWSRTTFLLLHRWMALLCAIHAAIHSLVYLYIAHTDDGWVTEFTLPYWIWGTVATICFSILILASVRPIREVAYELFIISHIVLTILAAYGSYHHIVDKYTTAYGYQNWVWLAIALWVFDRVIRFARMARHGVRRAFITHIDNEYYRVDIPGITAVGHTYLHFPTVSKWRFWESHPFSVAAVTYCNKVSSTTASRSASVTEVIHEPKDSLVVAPASPVSTTGSDIEAENRELGIVLFVRKQRGLTAKLMNANWGLKGLPVLVEGSYGHSMLTWHSGEMVPTSEFPNLICIAGGVGITGVLPALASFNCISKATGTKKLYWGVRTTPLLHSLEQLVGFDLSSNEARSSRSSWKDVDVTVSLGERLALRSLLETDLRTNQGGTIIAVCGPLGMTDDVRTIVAGLSRHDKDGKPLVVKLVIEAFNW